MFRKFPQFAAILTSSAGNSTRGQDDVLDARDDRFFFPLFLLFVLTVIPIEPVLLFVFPHSHAPRRCSAGAVRMRRHRRR